MICTLTAKQFSQKGFSLLELLIAIAILSAGITVIIQAFSYSAKAQALATDMIQAILLAEDKLQEIEFMKPKSEGYEPLKAENNGDTFKWDYLLSPFTETDTYLLRLNIAWQRARREETLVFVEELSF